MNTEIAKTENELNSKAVKEADAGIESGSQKQPLILADNLVKIYKTTELEVMALQGLDLSVDEGELLAIIGNSGSGKSTFLNMLGGLDTPSAGRLYVDGKNLFTMTKRELIEYKRNTVGFVWQNNARNLLPYLTAVENVMTPMQFSGEKKKREKALELLDLVGMSARKNSRLSSLSGGEQQRIAIAIALANSPKLLLADEPTGSVDRKTADYILDVFRRMNREKGQTILIVTHDTELAKAVPRVVAIRDGKISSEILNRQRREENAGQGTGESFTNDVKSLAGKEEEGCELAVLDRAGRVQIPAAFLEAAGITSRHVKLECHNGVITLKKSDTDK